MKFFLSFIVAFLAFTLLACDGKKEFDIAQIDISKPFDLEFFEGGKLEIKAEQKAIYTNLNKPVIYTFFTSWCEVCKVEAQLLSSLNDRFKGEVKIIGVLMEDLEKKELETYKKDFGINYQISIGTPNIILDKALGGVDGTPYTIITGKDGTIAWAGAGVVDIDILENLLKKLLENQI